MFNVAPPTTPPEPEVGGTWFHKASKQKHLLDKFDSVTKYYHMIRVDDNYDVGWWSKENIKIFFVKCKDPYADLKEIAKRGDGFGKKVCDERWPLDSRGLGLKLWKTQRAP